MPENFDEAVIQGMVDDSIASLGGKETAGEGWNVLFQAHNEARGKGSVSYAAGEKIAIKANINGSGVFDDDTSGETQMSYTNPVLLKGCWFHWLRKPVSLRRISPYMMYAGCFRTIW